MVSRADRRRLNRLQRDREREIDKEQRSNTRTLAIGAAAAVGIGYVAYQGRDEIVDRVSSFVGQNTIRLNRATGNATFRGKIEETKNLTRAFTDTYTKGSVKEIIAGVTHRKKRASQFNERLKGLNSTLEEAINSAVPKDVSGAVSALAKMSQKGGENSSKAFSAAMQENLAKVMESDKYKDVFDGYQADIKQVFQENPNVLRNMGKLRGDEGTPLSIRRLFAEHNQNDKKSVDFNIHNADKRESFMKAMFDAAKETQEQTAAQRTDYLEGMKHKNSKLSEDNTYAKYKNLYDIVSFEGVREQQRQETQSFISKGLQKEGFREATIKDARELYVSQQEGKWMISDKDAPDALRFDHLFSPVRSTDGEPGRGFADRFVESGRRLGVDIEELNAARYSQYVHINDKTGEVLSSAAASELMNEGLDFMQDNFQVPMIRVNPLDMKSRRFNQQQANAPQGTVYEKGWVSAFTKEGLLDTGADANTRNSGSKGVLNKQYIHIGETIYDGDLTDALGGGIRPEEAYKAFVNARDAHKVAEGYTVADVGTGHIRRYAETLSGRTSIEPDQVGAVRSFLKLNQENESHFDRLGRLIVKKENPMSAQNILATSYDELNPTETVNEIHHKLSSSIRGLSPQSEDILHDTIVDAINSTHATFDFTSEDMKTEEGLARIAEGIASQSKINREYTISSQVKDHMRQNVARAIGWNSDDPNAIFDRTAYMQDKNIFRTSLQNAIYESSSGKVTGQELLKRQIEQYGIMIREDQGLSFDSLVGQAADQSKVAAEIEDLRSLTISSFFNKKLNEAETVEEFSSASQSWKSLIGSDSTLAGGLQQSLLRTEPTLSAGISPRKERLLGQTQYMPMKKYQSPLQAINEAYSSQADTPSSDNRFEQATRMAEGLMGWARETGGGLFKGEGGEVTNRHVGPWNIADNLDKRLQNWGLGLPNDKKGSIASIMGNQWFYRIAVPYIGYQYAKYVDDMTGGRISKGLASTYANMSLDVAEKKERLGINDRLRTAHKLMPYLEHADEWAPVKLANAATFGALTNRKSREELQAYYESGSDPIRKGAYWGIASGTPWMGNRIDYYRPNWYRRTMSDWQYTDTKWGSRAEYWNNHWLPTPTAPWAPLNRYLLDPYHWENKHYDSRPYAVTGGFEELRSIPLIGPAVDRGVSRIVKPPRQHSRLEKSHRQYLQAENERIVSAYTNLNAGGSLSTTPGGSVRLNPDQYVVEFTDEDGQLDEDALYADSIRFSSEEQATGSGIAGGPRLVKGRGRAAREVKQQIEQYNRGITAHQDPVQQVNPSQAGSIYKPTTVYNLNDAIDTNSLMHPKGAWEEMYFNAGGFAGLRGFLSRSMLGYRPNDTRTPYLQTSDRFNDYSRRFWQSGWGGFGGDISEIFRRYVQNPQRRNHYNPIRNTQPGWLPGPEYYIDFLHGSPFEKIDYGEIRLPGSAYESIHSVRKDEFGNYSAFDRYRILADVAPYSDQYRLAKQEVSLLNQSNMLTERQQAERRVIDEQVKSRRQTRHMYDKQYSNAVVDRKTVTITQVLDQNSFLTEEYGDQVMKLAGVEVRQDDTESVGLVNSFLQAGQKVDIEMDADPNRRIRDDIVNSQRVVVYGRSRNPMSTNAGGNNLNYLLSQQEGMTIRDDGTAVATRALTSSGHITVGKMMETVMHDIVPHVPIVNIFADKFMPVRTPVEQYKRELYNKQFRSWTNPIDGWIRPMFETGASLNPALATLRGAGIGALIHRATPSNSRALTAGVVGTGYGIIAGVRTLYEAKEELTGDGERWIPKRRQQEREVEEYFDKVKYVKYKGLFERAADLAEKREGVNLRRYLADTEEDGRQNKGLESYLKEQKKWLTIEEKKARHEGAKALIKEDLQDINERIKAIDLNRENLNVGPYTALAMRYKEEYESTLYASANSGDVQKIFRALPKKDKEFFTAFQNASPGERTKLLKLVPQNQRNMYRRQFGMAIKEEDDESIESYFSRMNLPGRNWEGWRADTSLDNIKVKVMQNEGLDTTEANFWDEDLMRAEESGARPITIDQSGGMVSSLINRLELEKALKGAGLKDVRITMETSASDNFQFVTNFNIQREREKEIEEGVKEYMQYG